MNLHKRLVEAWKNMPAGGKSRLPKLGHSQQHIDYILKNPKYTNYSKMELLLNAIKQVSKDIARDIAIKNTKVQKA